MYDSLTKPYTGLMTQLVQLYVNRLAFYIKEKWNGWLTAYQYYMDRVGAITCLRWVASAKQVQIKQQRERALSHGDTQYVHSKYPIVVIWMTKK